MENTDCLIGLDIGTSAVKGVLLVANGKILATACGKFNYYGEESARLLEPMEFIQVCFGVIKELADKCPSDCNISGICSCCASGNLIFLDKDFKPFTHIIGWQSNVDNDEFSSYYTEIECEEIYKAVGWPVINGFPIAYFPWIAKNKKNIISDAKMICMSAEYLNYSLTGNWGISYSMATPFYLLDQEKGDYCNKLLNKFGIIREQLPPIYQKGKVIGKIKPEVASYLGLSNDVKVVLGSFDHPSGATGAGVFTSNDILVSCGTSWVLFFPINSRMRAIETGLLVDRFMINKTPYCVMKSIPSLSPKIEKLRNFYLGDISHRELDELIVKSEYGCNGLKFNFDEDDFKIAGKYSKHDIARAIYESAARLLKHNLSECEALGLSGNRVALVGGITNSNVCVKVVSEILEKETVVINGASAGAVGAAMLAAIGVGIYSDEVEAFDSMNFKTVKL